MNYSIYSILAAWLVAILPHWYAISIANSKHKFDNTNPRHATQELEKRLTKEELETYKRAEAAQQNGFENLSFFACGVIAANYAKVPVGTINFLCFCYLISRAIYNVLYIKTTTLQYSYFRTITFLTGIIICFTLFIKAGNAINQ
ncbi:hypothetical protein AKO1_007311 [Acrasis kona]|uniref:MAPEG family protein n=1 Tax=Acrasis kona TaxID=1008807 RepID=A0AAW2YRD4_9EUKA